MTWKIEIFFNFISTIPNGVDLFPECVLKTIFGHFISIFTDKNVLPLMFIFLMILYSLVTNSLSKTLLGCTLFHTLDFVFTLLTVCSSVKVS